MRRKANPGNKLAQRELTKHVRIASGMGRANTITPSPPSHGPQSLVISEAQLSAGDFFYIYMLLVIAPAPPPCTSVTFRLKRTALFEPPIPI